jgi:hypothetical protein
MAKLPFTLTNLRKWRDELAVDSPVLTRDNREAIICRIKKDKYKILIGKGHMVNVAKDDVFPIEWAEYVEDWRHRKSERGPDIALN